MSNAIRYLRMALSCAVVLYCVLILLGALKKEGAEGVLGSLPLLLVGNALAAWLAWPRRSQLSLLGGLPATQCTPSASASALAVSTLPLISRVTHFVIAARTTPPPIPTPQASASGTLPRPRKALLAAIVFTATIVIASWLFHPHERDRWIKHDGAIACKGKGYYPFAAMGRMPSDPGVRKYLVESGDCILTFANERVRLLDTVLVLGLVEFRRYPVNSGRPHSLSVASIRRSGTSHIRATRT